MDRKTPAAGTPQRRSAWAEEAAEGLHPGSACTIINRHWPHGRQAQGIGLEVVSCPPPLHRHLSATIKPPGLLLPPPQKLSLGLVIAGSLGESFSRRRGRTGSSSRHTPGSRPAHYGRIAGEEAISARGMPIIRSEVVSPPVAAHA